ncbi:MAG: methylated-DNA--[protein]-cysteine S-methyltransferase [Chlorobiaceae bacterium]|nr:methylated-DNA--[protein]-cysteine S-methyltransferase [Chlorobiaceae bacterium]
MKLFCKKTEIGTIGIADSGGFISNLFFDPCAVSQEIERAETALVREAFHQLEAYLRGELKVFSLPLEPAGTPFMKHVWEVLATIPYATRASYGEIAGLTGHPHAMRAVGSACGRNPVPLFIPCHRVVRSDGSQGGYRGGSALKARLLELEKSIGI